MMTGRERVRRCLEFERPDRPPRDLWFGPIARIEHGDRAIDDFMARWPGDITQCDKGRQPSKREKGDPHKKGQYRDEWGCVFENLKDGVIGEVKGPIVSDWSRLSEVSPPTEFLNVDRDAVATFYRSTDKFVFGGGWARPFERLQFLRGTENVYMDLGEGSPEFMELLKIVHGFYRSQYEVWAGMEVDALVMMDDWGSQRSLLISPAQWREVFKPLYAEYVKIAHAGGKKFFMHSDGYIFDIYEDLIEIGVDAVNSQLFCMDIDAIGREFAGRITFWGEIDRQHILPYGTVRETEMAVERVVKHLHRPEGGVIAQFDVTTGAKMENCEAVFRTWDRLTGHGAIG